MAFRRRTEAELQGCSDDELIAYLRAAARAGDGAAARTALAILVYGHMEDVTRRMRLRVPAEVAEEQAHEVLVRAIASAFDGTSKGEFHAWLNVLVKRTAADYYRRRARRPREEALPSERGGEEPVTPDETGLVDTRELLDRVLDELSPTHRRVVELFVLEDLDAATTASRIEGMSADNVSQIVSRFRRRFRDLLDTER